MTTAHSSDVIRLPAARLQSDVSVEQAISSRRSVREYSKQPLALAEVAQLLWSAQGETDGAGHRAAPSAGALYPLEIYLVAGNVSGLAQGIYQYSSVKHQLQRLQNDDRREQLATAAHSQGWMKKSPAWLIFSAVESRTTRKYGKRGIRYIHVEVGHSAQNVFLQAQALGLVAAVVGAFDGSAIKNILELPGEQQVLYLMPVGRAEN